MSLDNQVRRHDGRTTDLQALGTVHDTQKSPGPAGKPHFDCWASCTGTSMDGRIRSNNLAWVTIDPIVEIYVLNNDIPSSQHMRDPEKENGRHMPKEKNAGLRV